MKYTHGIDEEKHDKRFIITNRLVSSLSVFVSSFFLVLLVYSAYWNWSRTDSIAFLSKILVFFGIPMILPQIPISLFECFWRNTHYVINEKGLSIYFPFSTKNISWEQVNKVYLAPVCRSRNGSKTYDYLIVLLNGSKPPWERLSLYSCMMNSSHLIAIRSTAARIEEFSRFGHGPVNTKKEGVSP